MHGRDHRKGGADPIPGIGDGIKFDTYFQEGHHLIAEVDAGTPYPPWYTTPGTGVPTSIEVRYPNMPLPISGGGGMLFVAADFSSWSAYADGGTINLYADPIKFGVINIDTYQLFMSSTGDSAIGAGGQMTISSTDRLTLETVNADVLTLVVGGNAIARIGTLDANGWGFRVEDPLGSPVFAVKWDGGFLWEYHIKSGAAWVADL